MRLGQLARKLEVRPIEIVEFLATQNIEIVNGPNTRILSDHVALAAAHFSPGLSIEDTADDAAEASVEAIQEIKETGSSKAADEPENIPNKPPVEKIDVIKAPKIELSGLKVLGKIDLPEPPKKEADPAPENVALQNESKRVRRPKELRRNAPKNPIALQREQEAREAGKKREEENRLKKERRTQNYLKKVKAPQPTKAARIFNEETQQISASDLHEPPKSLWAKFIKWLTT